MGVAYIFVADFFEYMRMRNFSVLFLEESIILLEYNTFYIPLGATELEKYWTIFHYLG